MAPYQTIIHTIELSEHHRRLISAEIPGLWFERDTYFIIHHEESVAQPVLSALRHRLPFDINPLPPDFQAAQVRLLVSDMDSTLITIECIDEIADFHGLKPQVADITEAAMRGDLDFETALKQRVQLLKGLPLEALQQVYNERLTLSPGAESMLQAVQNNGIKTALVSGGFTFFTDQLQQRLGLDYTLACTLEAQVGHLTGQVSGPVVDAEAKAGLLLKLCHELEIKPWQVVAIGDGANDVNMLQTAGLGVAFRAKPSAQTAADVCLQHSGLEGVCQLLQLPTTRPLPKTSIAQ